MPWRHGQRPLCRRDLLTTKAAANSSPGGFPSLAAFIERLATPARWRALGLEIARWRAEGHAPSFWWRDDDARRPSPALERLGDLSAATAIPVALAVIPDVDLSALAGAIDRRPLISTIQHGCDHIDRGAAGAASAEFDPATPAAQIAPLIESAWRRLSSMTRTDPIYAPPWNVLTANVARALDGGSLRAVSLYGESGCPESGLPNINAHVDIMSWRPARFRGEAALIARIGRLLASRRRAARWESPIGILTHHRNLDEQAWGFLETFTAWSRAEGGQVRWRSAGELLRDADR